MRLFNVVTTVYGGDELFDALVHVALVESLGTGAIGGIGLGDGKRVLQQRLVIELTGKRHHIGRDENI